MTTKKRSSHLFLRLLQSFVLSFLIKLEIVNNDWVDETDGLDTRSHDRVPSSSLKLAKHMNNPAVLVVGESVSSGGKRVRQEASIQDDDEQWIQDKWCFSWICFFFLFEKTTRGLPFCATSHPPRNPLFGRFDLNTVRAFTFSPHSGFYFFIFLVPEEVGRHPILKWSSGQILGSWFEQKALRSDFR